MFTTMLEGTKDDWMHIASEHMKHQQSAAATQIIDSLTTEWDPSQYRDTYADELRKMIDEKAKHGTISV